MSRLLAIDFGTKRCGLAVTDPNKMIATALESLPTRDLIDYLKKYLLKEQLEKIIIGEPKRLNNTVSETTLQVYAFAEKIKSSFPDIPVVLYDERLTSKIASRSLIESGQSRKVRRDKSVLDRVSATLLLQDFLNSLSPQP